MKPGHSIAFRTYLLLWIAATVTPFLILPFSFLTAGVIGITLTVLWIALMPNSCISGAFICFPLSLIQIGIGLMWSVRLCFEIRN